MSKSQPVEVLYADCLRLLAAGPAAGTKTRSLAAGADWSTLLVWNVLVAGMIHLGCDLMAHSLRDRFARLRAKFSSLQLRKTTPAEIQAAAEEARAGVAEAIPQLPQTIDPNVRSEAAAKLRDVLVDVGWTGVDAEQRAREIVELLTLMASRSKNRTSE